MIVSFLSTGKKRWDLLHMGGTGVSILETRTKRGVGGNRSCKAGKRRALSFFPMFLNERTTCMFFACVRKEDGGGGVEIQLCLQGALRGC